jgi:hypothetical protein
MLYFCASPKSFVLELASGSSIVPSIFMAAGSDWIDAPSTMGCIPFSEGCPGACAWALSFMRSSGEEGGMCACRKPDGCTGRCWIWLDPDPVDNLEVSPGRGVLEAMALAADMSMAALYFLQGSGSLISNADKFLRSNNSNYRAKTPMVFWAMVINYTNKTL